MDQRSIRRVLSGARERGFVESDRLRAPPDREHGPDRDTAEVNSASNFGQRRQPLADSGQRILPADDELDDFLLVIAQAGIFSLWWIATSVPRQKTQ